MKGDKPKYCLVCKRDFSNTARRPNQKTCGEDCSRKYNSNPSKYESVLNMTNQPQTNNERL